MPYEQRERETETISGKVTRTSKAGFQLADEPGVWWNYSRYADNLERPSQGDSIEADVDDDNWVYACRVTERGASGARPTRSQTRTEGRQGRSSERVAQLFPDDARQRLIVRQSALKAAVDLSISGQGPIVIADVKALAEEFVRWVFEEKQVFCEDCGTELQPQKFNDGSEWSAERLAAEGQQHFERNLCYPDFKKRYTAEQQRREAAGRPVARPVQEPDSDLADLPF